MNGFIDEFTGTIYKMGPVWLRSVQETIANDIYSVLQKQSERKAAADEVARFWSDTYYERLFPLRFGLGYDDDGLYRPEKLFGKEQGPINLEPRANETKRKRFLDEDSLPPLLPAFEGQDQPSGAEEKETTELLADRLLTQAALANLLLRQRNTEEALVHEVRLACLTYPLFAHLSEPLRDCPRVADIARFLCGERDTLPANLELDLLTSIRDLANFGDLKVRLAQVAVQRIKQYVFETSGLNEIRGASTLLDELTMEAKKLLANELGPEVILRAVGSTLLFLTPTKEAAQRQVKRISHAFYQTTGTAFTVTAATYVPVEQLLNDYNQVMKRLGRVQEESRAAGEQPIYEALPFEARCQVCRTRPAEGWIDLPGVTEPSPICKVCFTKRDSGSPGREGKAKQLLEWLDLKNPNRLGVSGTKPYEYVAPSLGMVDDEDEPGFIPAGRRPLLATIYGDGNNFGAIGQNLTSVSQARQWTQRVEKINWAAAAIALARATQETAVDRDPHWDPQNPAKNSKPPLPRLPFQILALGGDDFSLFAWAPVGIRFASHFLEMIDLEFQVPAKESNKPRIAYSMGALITDHKAAVRRTVKFTEEELLKWAKKAFRESELKQGNIATLLANTLEQIPDDLKRYRLQMYEREGALTLYLTLRPYSSEELRWLLQKAQSLREASGPFHRLVSVFAQSSPLQAMLHYIYQLGRFNKIPDHWLKNLDKKDDNLPESLRKLVYPATAQSTLERKPFGLDSQDGQAVWFTPLWDLLELVKILE